MIETSWLQAGGILCLRFQGMQAGGEFAALGETLLRERTDRFLRLLFDWSGLTGVDSRLTFNLACRSWHRVALLTERAAIIHTHKYDHHAALLAAVFRVNGAEVRSWPLRDHAHAEAWLASPLG
jgi:hypothetical protein